MGLHPHAPPSIKRKCLPGDMEWPFRGLGRNVSLFMHSLQGHSLSQYLKKSYFSPDYANVVLRFLRSSFLSLSSFPLFVGSQEDVSRPS